MTTAMKQPWNSYKTANKDKADSAGWTSAMARLTVLEHCCASCLTTTAIFCWFWWMVAVSPTSSIPTLSIPIWSTSHFVNSHLVNSHYVNFHLVNVDKVGIDKVGIDEVGIDKGYFLKMWCCLYELDIGIGLTVWWMCWPLYTQHVLLRIDRTTVGWPWKFHLRI